jgi:hypothetical protein
LMRMEPQEIFFNISGILKSGHKKIDVKSHQHISKKTKHDISHRLKRPQHGEGV